jgi:lipopolysaccharide transport system permease protein
MWLVAHPLVLVAAYLFVFGYVMKLQVGEPEYPKSSYALYFLSAFAPWLALSDILSRGSTIIQQNAALVKQIVFPVVVLPVKTSLATLLGQLPLFAVVIAYALIEDIMLLRTILMVIVLLGFLMLLMCGLSFILSSLGLFVRDLQDVMQLWLAIGIFVTPVLYTPAMLQGSLGTVVALNPLSAPIYCFRDVLFYGRPEHPSSWVAFAAMAVGTFVVGHWLFKRLAPAFGDAL